MVDRKALHMELAAIARTPKVTGDDSENNPSAEQDGNGENRTNTTAKGRGKGKAKAKETELEAIAVDADISGIPPLHTTWEWNNWDTSLTSEPLPEASGSSGIRTHYTPTNIQCSYFLKLLIAWNLTHKMNNCSRIRRTHDNVSLSL